jgi:Fur family ferric uptake transcriptional regulator
MCAREQHKWFWDCLRDHLIFKGLKQTKQRHIIVQKFLEMNPHVDVEDLYQAIRKEGLNVGLATVYRTLNLLKEAGLVDQNTFNDGRAVFELLPPGEHHDHLICTYCGIIIEFKNQEIEKLQQQIAQTFEFHLMSHRLDMFGSCSGCKSRSVRST